MCSSCHAPRPQCRRCLPTGAVWGRRAKRSTSAPPRRRCSLTLTLTLTLTLALALTLTLTLTLNPTPISIPNPIPIPNPHPNQVLLRRLLLMRERREAAAELAWTRVLAALRADAPALGSVVRRMASLDCLQALAAFAASPGYCAPTLLADEHPATIDIRGGRHPLVAARLAGRGAAFVPNDTALGGGGGGGGDGDGSEGGQAGALVLMGPNMGGKSCYARQVGLIVLLAQLGSYVPADACALTPMRALFTRMGAADQLCRGRSTFQNELAEAAEALQNLGPRTLLLLDELGRGTSTHDGATISASTPPPPPIPAPYPSPSP